MTASLATLLLSAALFGCCVALPNGEVESEKDNSTLVYPEDLPTNKWTWEKLEALKEALSNLEDAMDMGNATDIAVKRVKRAAGDNSHWCCKTDPPIHTATRTIQRARVVPKQIPIRESYKCGFLSLSTCYRTKIITRFEIEYYLETNVYEVPAPEFQNGCPRDLIQCCEGYLTFPPHLDNCLTAEQMLEYIPVLESLLSLGLLG